LWRSSARRFIGRGGSASDYHLIWNIFAPADGTRAAAVGNGDFGTSPIFWQLSGNKMGRPM